MPEISDSNWYHQSGSAPVVWSAGTEGMATRLRGIPARTGRI